ncbi:MAG: 5-formyltetrahydrofolate cyclo-ligase [Spirochaetes bacterium]|nr:5-formyltetrahydrofolate cyclo-ligase [Spirochaetota bacterium]
MEKNEFPVQNVQEEKAKLRKKIKNLYKILARQEIAEKSKKILNNLKLLEIWSRASTILAFLPLSDEVDTTFIIEDALMHGKKVAVPRIKNNDMAFLYITSLAADSLKKHDFGMYEPLPTAEPVNMENKDSADSRRILILTPGIAFDKQCNRLGRGKSFYDRFLSKYGKNCIKAGIAFNFQIAENLPIEEHDVQLDFVITDENIFSSGSGA